MRYKKFKIQRLSMEVSFELISMCLIPKYKLCLESVPKASNLTAMRQNRAEEEQRRKQNNRHHHQIPGDFPGTW